MDLETYSLHRVWDISEGHRPYHNFFFFLTIFRHKR